MSELDDDVDALFHKIGCVCDQKNVGVIIPALSHMLVAAIMASGCTLAGVDDYCEILHERLRDEWRKQQQAGQNGNGSEPA